MRVSESSGSDLGYTPRLVPLPMSSPSPILKLSGLFALILLVLLPAAANADDFFADLDRDGVRDIVTIPKAPARGLLVWLSSSGSFLRLPTRRPITGVTVRDIDGDGRVDLVAADASAKLHVWHRTLHGLLKTTRPRHPVPLAGPTRSRTFDQSSGTDTPAIGAEAPSDLTSDAVHPEAPTLDLWRLISDSARQPLGLRPDPPHDPRGPPAPH
jgi:hypothetical protein